MRPPDTAPRGFRAKWLVFFLVLIGASILTGATASLGQADYTGVPPLPGDTYVDPVDTYVGTYTGQEPGGGTAAVVVRLPPSTAGGGTDGTMAVGNSALGDPPAVMEGDGRLVTGWDLVTMTALGLIAIVGFAVSAARFRSP